MEWEGPTVFSYRRVCSFFYNCAEFAVWTLHGALLHALVCHVPRAPRDEGTSLRRCCHANDRHHPSPSSRDELCHQRQQWYLTTLCEKHRSHQFGDASLVDPLMPIVQDDSREPYRLKRVCESLGFTHIRKFIIGNLYRFLSTYINYEKTQFKAPLGTNCLTFVDASHYEKTVVLISLGLWCSCYFTR